MPQFQPKYWISLITWSYLLIIIILTYTHTNLLPNILKLKLVRKYILFI
jgi:hypothetical protein